MKKVLWEEMRKPEFEQAVKDDAVIIIPLGSIEQHGDHLPVNTDSFDCMEMAKRAAMAVDDVPVLVLPVIWTGFSGMHMTRHGTITLNNQTLLDVLTQVAESVYAHGFTKVFFLNGHGGNNGPVGTMRMKIAYESHCPTPLVMSWMQMPSFWEATGYGPGGVQDHAGELETSIVMYLQPELVDKDSLSWVEGVYGDPSKATAERGEAMVKGVIDDLVGILRKFHAGQMDDGWGWTEQPMAGKKDGSVKRG